MKHSVPAVLAAALFALVLSTFALAEDLSNGTWTIQPARQGNIELELRSEGSGDEEHISAGSYSSPQEIGLQPGDLNSPSHSVHFTIRRDAGTLDFTGTVGDGVGAGHYTYAPNAAYADGVAKRGYDRPTARQQLVATTLDISNAYIDGIIATGVRPSSFAKLIAFRALRVTPQGIRDLRQQFGALDEESVITFTALHIDTAYIKELAAAGYTNLSSHEVTELKALHVDGAYIRRVQAHGYKHPTVQQLVELKALKII